jgi:hypothetical protein
VDTGFLLPLVAFAINGFASRAYRPPGPASNWMIAKKALILNPAAALVGMVSLAAPKF